MITVESLLKLKKEFDEKFPSAGYSIMIFNHTTEKQINEELPGHMFRSYSGENFEIGKLPYYIVEELRDDECYEITDRLMANTFIDKINFNRSNGMSIRPIITQLRRMTGKL